MCHAGRQSKTWRPYLPAKVTSEAPYSKFEVRPSRGISIQPAHQAVSDRSTCAGQ